MRQNNQTVTGEGNAPRVTWKSNGLIQGRDNQVELIRSDKYAWDGPQSIIVKGSECEEIAAYVLEQLNKLP